MNFLPEKDAQKRERSAGPSLFLISVSTCLFQGLPALAEKIEQTTVVTPQHPPNTALIGLFTVLNYVAGIAAIAAIVFGVIWFLQKRNEPDEEVVDAEVTSTEGEAAAKADTKPEEAKSDETKPDEAKSDEAKSEETKA